jgi:hypothetical protein
MRPHDVTLLDASDLVGLAEDAQEKAPYHGENEVGSTAM